MKIGAVVRTGPLGNNSEPARFPAIREMARRMQAAGLDSIWVYDHLLYRWSGRATDGIWESWTMLAALAEATERVELGPLVACSPFRDPALLAKMAVSLDEISGGRLILGLGAGWHEPEFTAFGIPFDHRVSRFEEALQIIGPLLRTGKVDFEGKYYRARDCEIVPRGPRASGPPLLVAGAGPKMLTLAARHADSWNTAWHDTPESAVPRLESMRSVCRRDGRDPSTLGLTACVAVQFPDLGGGSTRTAALSGTPEQICESLRGFAALGLEHVMIEFAPYTEAALDRFADAVHRFHGD